MEETEKWKAHPTRKNIFIDQNSGLLYERLSGGWHNMIEQEMSVCQELEIFRKADGVVRMTSRRRGRIPQPSDKTLSEESD